MILKLYNPDIKKEIEVKEDESFYDNELQKVYDKEIDFIIFTDAKTNNPITIRPSNWAVIEVKEWNAKEILFKDKISKRQS